MGVGLHIFKLLKEQNLNTASSLKHKDQHSVFFNISMGVKQGDSLRDRPFNLKRGGGGGLWFFASFRIFFSDNTRVIIFIFPEFTIRLYDKNSESDYFFPPPKSEYFFQRHWESEYYF